MTFTILKELTFNDICEETWCCDDLLQEIADNNLEVQFMDLLGLVFTEAPDITDLNDFLRFDDDSIRGTLGLEIIE